MISDPVTVAKALSDMFPRLYKIYHAWGLDSGFEDEDVDEDEEAERERFRRLWDETQKLVKMFGEVRREEQARGGYPDDGSRAHPQLLHS